MSIIECGFVIIQCLVCLVYNLHETPRNSPWLLFEWMAYEEKDETDEFPPTLFPTDCHTFFNAGATKLHAQGILIAPLCVQAILALQQSFLVCVLFWQKIQYISICLVLVHNHFGNEDWGYLTSSSSSATDPTQVVKRACWTDLPPPPTAEATPPPTAEPPWPALPWALPPSHHNTINSDGIQVGNFYVILIRKSFQEHLRFPFNKALKIWEYIFSFINTHFQKFEFRTDRLLVSQGLI